MYLLHFLSVDDVYVKIHMDDGRTIYFLILGRFRTRNARKTTTSLFERKKMKKRNVIHIWMDDDDDDDQMMEIIIINV